jgi:DNA-binding transcriptional regulator GbsR (MarR family)
LSEAPTTSPDPTALARFIERFALDLAASGMPRMPARVFAGLLATDSGSLTATELADLLKVSPASVSGAVRYLDHVGLVSREREPGSRRDHYVLRDDVWSEIIERRDRELVRWQDTLAQGIEALGSHTRAGTRMTETLAFFEFLHEELRTVLRTWRHRKADLVEDWVDTT